MIRKLAKAILPTGMHASLERTLGRTIDGECGQFTFAQGRAKVDRIAIVNHLAVIYGFETYLEIGVRNRADMFDQVICARKVGVDPDPNAEADYQLTSDDFFRDHSERRFDLIFIDGDHTGEQVERDIGNALEALNPGGIILLHDLNPPTEFHARVDFEVNGEFPPWNGTSWQGFAAYRQSRSDLEMYVIDTDWGVGFIRAGRQAVYQGPVGSYQDLEANRIELLNLITVRDFLRRHPHRRLRWGPFDRLLS